MCKQINLHLIILFSFTRLITSNQEFNVPLEYSIGDDEFHALGQINIRKNFDQIMSEFLPASVEKINALKNSLVSNPSQFYRIRNGGLFSTNLVNNFIPPHFGHAVELTVDVDRQKILSITHFSVYGMPNGSAIQNDYFPLQIRVKESCEISGPDTASYLQRIEEEKRMRQQGATQDNRSFIQKYWIYFVPVVLFMILSNAFNPEPQQE